MGFMLIGLGGFGIQNFSGGSSSDIGQAGDISVTAGDYARGVRNEMQNFSQRMGKAMTMEEAKQIGVPQIVLSRLFLSASLENEANRLGISVGDKTVGEQLLAIQAFRGLTGQFDRKVYADTLRQEGMTERQFEHDLRMDQARLMLQQAVTGGIKAPEAMTNLSASWLLETRNIRWQELLAKDLAAPVVAPDEATLEAWHKANADRFTAPEIRKITYVWITPEMIEEKVQIDDQALRDLYQQRIAEFVKPERRMVEKLVFQDDAAAAAAKARLDKGEVDFEGLAKERGLTLNDVDLGEVTKDQLGAAGDQVFALTQPGVTGPLPTNLGPALFSMNAILEPVNTTFEEAKPELRGEAALDRARRQIDEMRSQIDDELASGATLEDLAKDKGLELGKIDWTQSEEPAQGSIAGYPAFRSAAGQVTTQDFAELKELDDGGIFALRLDETVPPTLIPFEEARPRVTEDWIASETHRRLLALADEGKVAAMSKTMAAAATETATTAGAAPETTAPETTAPETTGTETATAEATTPVPGSDEAAVSAEADKEPWHEVASLPRDGFISGTPQALVPGAFGLKEVGDTDIVSAENRVFLVTLEAINKADLGSDQAKPVLTNVGNRIGQSLQQDLFDYYARAVQAGQGVTINQAAIDAANSRM
ncbi:peptidyl-prolyl cis-trans isomerase D [Paracoccus aminophilus JCM 7686]|uniref:Peptidyl-prolyl cis-trans isomerase D n=2 Tax=Paracoccus aminophilus TaxID=34003 RepID=S5YRI0_PARAH|nr:peptidyl-prolyl cis-trans isomerase D [Paracoccus aminophilus JCM 7686]